MNVAYYKLIVEVVNPNQSINMIKIINLLRKQYNADENGYIEMRFINTCKVLDYVNDIAEKLSECLNETLYPTMLKGNTENYNVKKHFTYFTIYTDKEKKKSIPIHIRMEYKSFEIYE